MFYDVRRYKSYSDFVYQKAHDAPYRGSTAYSLGARRYSARHWRMNDDGSVGIYYCNRDIADQILSGEKVQHEEWYKKRKLATVYPDDTVEFHYTSGQGDHGLLARVFGVHMYQSSKRGGVVLQWGDKKHPVFKGQRFRMDNFDSVTPYQIFHRTVNRKLANEAMKEYQEFLQVGKAMTDAMDEKGIAEVGHFLTETIKGDHTHKSYNFLYRKVNPEFFEMIKNKHYVDAAVLFGINYNIQNARWRLTNGNNIYSSADTTWIDRFKFQLFSRINTQLRKEVCIGHEAFNMTEADMGRLPTSHWPIKITSNGVEVERL